MILVRPTQHIQRRLLGLVAAFSLNLVLDGTPGLIVLILVQLLAESLVVARSLRDIQQGEQAFVSVLLHLFRGHHHGLVRHLGADTRLRYHVGRLCNVQGARVLFFSET